MEFLAEFYGDGGVGGVVFRGGTGGVIIVFVLTRAAV